MKKFVIVVIVLTLSQFVINSCMEDPVYYPVLYTIAVQDADITSTTATLKAEVTDAGNQRITEYGIEIYKHSLLNPAGKQGYQGSPDTGIYEVVFSGLESNTTYYFRAYALINTAEFYSQNTLHQFTTKPASR